MALERSAKNVSELLNRRGSLEPIHYRIVALCFLAWIFDFYDLILYSFLLVPIARELRLNAIDSSLALGTSFLMTAVGGISFGFIGDRFGRRPVIITTVLIYGLGTLLCGFATSLTSLLLFRSFTGLGIGGEWGAGQSLIAETFPPRVRARYAAYVQTGAPLGILMAALVGGYLAPAIGWRAVFTVSALPAALVAVAVWLWLPESDVWKSGASGRWHDLTDLRALAPYRSVFIALFFFLLVNSEAYWFTYSWLPGYLELRRLLSSAQAARLVTVMQVGAVAGYLAFGALADRFGRRPVFSAYGLMLCLGLLPATILWEYCDSIPGFIGASMAVAGFGTGMWSGGGPLISELFPTKFRNAALGLMLNATRGIQFFTPLAITALSARFGLAAALATGSVFAALGAMLVWRLPETRARPINWMD